MRTLMQDTASLQKSAALWASLIQVLMRCTVSYGSYKKAPESDTYTRREAKQAIFREAMAFVASYGIVKVVDSALKQGMNYLAGYQEVRPGTMGFFQAISQAGGILSGRIQNVAAPPEVMPGIHEFINTPSQEKIKGPLSQKNLSRFGAWLERKLPASQKTPSSTLLAKKGYSFLHTWVPIGLASIPSLVLSGWILERLTLKQGKQASSPKPLSTNTDPSKEIPFSNTAHDVSPYGSLSHNTLPAHLVHPMPTSFQPNLLLPTRTSITPVAPVQAYPLYYPNYSVKPLYSA